MAKWVKHVHKKNQQPNCSREMLPQESVKGLRYQAVLLFMAKTGKLERTKGK